MSDVSVWINRLNGVERQLIIEADYLLSREKNQPSNSNIVDYGFLVYPAAKAYEGFLKSYLYRNGLIDAFTFRNEHFRIGKAINPDLPVKYREYDWVWDDLSRLYGEDLPARLWLTWKKCRNRVFHFRPDKLRLYTLIEAQIKIELIFSTIEMAIDREHLHHSHIEKNHKIRYNTNQIQSL